VLLPAFTIDAETLQVEEDFNWMTIATRIYAETDGK
jgi:hypothetical protein